MLNPSTDTFLQHDGTGWLLGSCFQYYYHCIYPLTRQEHEFIEKYLQPAVQNLASEIAATCTPELERQYKDGVLKNEFKFDWFLK